MLGTLDPHSEFMEPIKYDDLKKDTQGEFGGVGIVISMKDNFLTVVAPWKIRPATKRASFRAIASSRLMATDRKTDLAGCRQTTPRRTGQRGFGDPPASINRQGQGIQTHRAQIKVDTVKDINGKREFPLSDNTLVTFASSNSGAYRRRSRRWPAQTRGQRGRVARSGSARQPRRFAGSGC